MFFNKYFSPRRSLTSFSQIKTVFALDLRKPFHPRGSRFSHCSLVIVLFELHNLPQVPLSFFRYAPPESARPGSLRRSARAKERTGPAASFHALFPSIFGSDFVSARLSSSNSPVSAHPRGHPLLRSFFVFAQCTPPPSPSLTPQRLQENSVSNAIVYEGCFPSASNIQTYNWL